MRLIYCIFLVLVAGNIAFGCMYGPPYATVCEKYENSVAVVVAKITSVKAGGLGQKVGLDIAKFYKGKLSGKIILDQPLSTCDWDFADSVGRTMLLYLKKNKGNTYHAIGTGYGGNLERESADIYWLENLPHSLKRNRISGTIRLYEDEPFEFIRGVSRVLVSITDGTRSFRSYSDDKGVFQLWDIPNGRYEIVPQLDKNLSIRFPLSSGDIEFKQVSEVEVDTNIFKVRIGEQKCGGSDYVVNAKNE